SYVIAFIPTPFDRNWKDIVEDYSVDGEGELRISTSYRRNGKTHSVRGKGFVDRTSGNSKWKVQYLWPFKADYWIIELADDYSYAVVGHPKKKFLYILARTPQMKQELYEGIVERCRKKGYDMNRLKKA
ncbi:MAG TPA: lipocalin family protein, partial [Bacteroidia bacterium]